jgi:hypothetical protein
VGGGAQGHAPARAGRKCAVVAEAAVRRARDDDAMSAARDAQLAHERPRAEREGLPVPVVREAIDADMIARRAVE